MRTSCRYYFLEHISSISLKKINIKSLLTNILPTYWMKNNKAMSGTKSLIYYKSYSNLYTKDNE